MAVTIGLVLPKAEKAKEPTKDELAARAAELGVEVPKSATKAQLAALVAEAEGK